MARLRKQRDIIDRQALTGKLDKLAGWSGYSDKTRADVLKIFKDALSQGWAEIKNRFESGNIKGAEAVAAHTFLIDQLIRTLHDFTVKYVYPVANPTKGEQIAIAATGGYGRGDLAPYSDIDLMFITPYKQTPHTEQVVEFMLYLLWDLGLKVGHATRSVEDAIRLAKDDMTICTSLLEARWLWGDKDLFDHFSARFQKNIVAAGGNDFVEAKLAERDERHDRMGDTRYVLEPNIKEGKGGLRDLHSLIWIAKYIYQVDSVPDLVEKSIFTKEDARLFSKAQNFLWTVRCHLHYLTGRPEDRLGFDVQTAIGERMGYTDHAGMKGVERFMKHYFLVAKDIGDLTRILCAVLEDQRKKSRFRMPSFSFRKFNEPGFSIDGDRLTVKDENVFSKNPVNLLKLFHIAMKQGVDIHPHALRLVTQNLGCIKKAVRNDEEANRLFMDMLTAKKGSALALRRLNEAGVFGRFLTDFGRVVAQMQYDMYHVYTVDEHTIRAIGILHQIESGELIDEHPLSSEVIHEVQSRDALFVSVLLHDIAKGRGGDHSEIGAKIALKLGPRFGLSEWDTETVSWLVLHHLAMSNTAFKRDLDDPKTVTDFVALVQSPERLRLLLVLTVVDIRAVGPNVWNAWKAGLLRELYQRALEVMTGGADAELRSSRVESAKHALRERLTNWTEAEIEEHLARGYPHYWLSFDTETHWHHAHIIKTAESKGLNLHIETRVQPERDATEFVIYTADHPGLFAKIAGAISLASASIVDAKIITLTNGMALDTFLVQDANGGPVTNKQSLNKLWQRIEDVLYGQVNPRRELEGTRKRAMPSRTRVFKVPPQVFIDNKASATYTVIEINGRDRIGLLHDVTAALTELGLQIASAHISTFGEGVVDVFYVKDVFGMKVTQDSKIRQIRDSVLAAIDSASVSEKTAQDAAAAE
ncbi:MAG: [protein-PII] uridylyltransferase [Rhodospirillales bacterium]